MLQCQFCKWLQFSLLYSPYPLSHYQQGADSYHCLLRVATGEFKKAQYALLYDSSVSSVLPFASSSLSNQLTLPTLLWIWLHKFTAYTEMKSGGFGLCYHTEEITFQLKTTALFGVGGHAGQGGNSRWMTLQFHKHFRPAYTCAAARRNGFPPTSLLILAQFVSTQQNRSRNYLKLNVTGRRRVFLTWNSSLTPFIT